MRRPFLALLCALLPACATTTSPRFEQEVATTFAQEEMRHLVTKDVEVYYPARFHDEAARLAARSSQCLTALRARALHPEDRGRAVLFLTPANYNNAYVGGLSAGEPLHSLNPLYTTSELFTWFGLSQTEPGDVSCHEMFHYAHFEQLNGLWWAVNEIFGPVMPSQAFLERWFTEGVAQYYEGRLGRPVGRPNSPLYRAAFASFAASRGFELGGGDLTVSERELLPYSGAYLTGLHFIEYLVETQGEEKLWELMELQGHSIFSPFGATLRFKAVYGLSVGAMLDQWSAHLKATTPVAERPAGQQVLRAHLGQLARLASHPASGTLAVISSGNEEVPMLRLFNRDGTLRAEQRLVKLSPDREWVLQGPSSVSGLSFSADGSTLSLMNDDLIARGDTRAQLWRIDAKTGEVLEVIQDLGTAVGGTLSPDGARYTFVDLGRVATVVEYTFATKQKTALFSLPPGVSAGGLSWSPDGARLVFSRFDANGWNLALREADGTLRNLTTDGAFDIAAHFADASHVVFSRTFEGKPQAHRLDVDTGALEVLTQAPWAVLDPVPLGDRVAFINRDGSTWSLDTAPAQPVSAATTLTLPPLPERFEPPPLQVEQDEAYSPLDHLFFPQARVPGVTIYSAGSGGIGVGVSASLMGRDRLGRHSWSIAGSYYTPDQLGELTFSYRNLQLAPWDLGVSGTWDRYPDESLWSAGVDLGRTVFTTPVDFGFQALVWQPDGARMSRFLGPTFSFAYAAGDTTGYGGAQHQLALSGAIAAYPKGLGSDFSMLDLSAAATFAVPLPGSTRHSLVFGAAGRTLPGAPDKALRIGGISRGTSLWQSEGAQAEKGPGGLLPSGLSQTLRGFDDYTFRATAVAVANARYRYSFIIDRGFASTLYLLPSLFFRQVDVEVFGAAAVTNVGTGTWARSAGAAAFVRMLGGGMANFSLYYQFAWRFDFNLPPLHMVGLAFE
jgi:hypothetical protein